MVVGALARILTHLQVGAILYPVDTSDFHRQAAEWRDLVARDQVDLRQLKAKEHRPAASK